MSSFDWEEYLIAADVLLEHDTKFRFSEEAAYRIAISRAYFAAHNTARDWYLKTCPTANPKQTSLSHSDLIRPLTNANNAAAARAGNDLDNLRKERNRADYRGDRSPTRKQTKSVVERARRVVGSTKTS